MSTDFWSFALPFPPEEGAALAHRLASCEVEYNRNIYCDIEISPFMDRLVDEVQISTCPNFAAFVAIDRFVAQPAGVDFLTNRAHRWVAPDEIAAFETTVQRLQALSLAEAELMVYRGRGDPHIATGMGALLHGLAQAKATGSGLLLACLPAWAGGASRRHKVGSVDPSAEQ